MKQSILKDKSKLFALRVIRLYKYLCEEKKEYVLSKQLLRSGTSIGANIAEAFYGMPSELQQETLKRLPEEMRAAYELFRQNLERKV